MDWLKDFCERYPREVGVPFEIFIEPKLVNERRMEMLRDAGLSSVYMGVQSSERVTGDLYDRKVKNQTIADIAQIYHRLGIKPHFQLIFDDPVSTEADKKALFEMMTPRICLSVHLCTKSKSSRVRIRGDRSYNTTNLGVGTHGNFSEQMKLTWKSILHWTLRAEHQEF